MSQGWQTSFPVERNNPFLTWKEQEVVGEFDRAMARLAERNASYGDDEIDADVEAAIAEVRTARDRWP